MEEDFSDVIPGHFLHILFQKLFEKDGGFKKVPKSDILYNRKFLDGCKGELNNYFYKSRGLKSCLDSLNKCLSEVANESDLLPQIEKFIEEMKGHLSRVNSYFKEEPGQRSNVFNEDIALKNMLCDVLILLETYIPIAIPKLSRPIKTSRYGKSQSDLVKIVPICIFDLRKTKYDASVDKIKILISDVNIVEKFEKDIWVVSDQLYMSHSFCDLYRGQECNIKVYKPKEKTLHMIKLKIPML